MRTPSLLLAVALAGCGTYGHALGYRFEGADRFPHGGRLWRIFDRQEESRLLIMPRFIVAFGQGVIGGATLHAVEPRIPKPEYQAAVAGFLVETGRGSCAVTDSYEVIPTEWEFAYSCPAVAESRAAPQRNDRAQIPAAFPPVTSSGGR